MFRKLLSAAAVTALLASCTASTQSSVTSGLQTAQAACTAAAPVINAVPQALAGASASVQATVASLVTYEQSVCASEAAITAAVSVDPSGGTGTAAWLENIAGGLLSALPAILALV